MINATWCISDNVGDQLTKWLIHKITGKQVVYVEHGTTIRKVMCAGSILNWANYETIVWGAGVANRDDKVTHRCDIRAVRGPVTAKIANACGAKVPDVYGDPGLLVPKFYPKEHTHEFSIGIIPHYVNQAEIFSLRPYLPKEIHLINVLCGVEEFVDQLVRCDAILSSSLHGLVLAVAYGIKCAWFEATRPLGGDGTKFADFFRSLDIKKVKPLKWHDQIGQSLVELAARCTQYELKPEMLDRLYEACPFKGSELDV